MYGNTTSWVQLLSASCRMSLVIAAPCPLCSVFGVCLFVFLLEVRGENRSGADDPHRESKPSAHAPAPHARHDRSMARSSLVARPILGEMSVLATPRVQRPIGIISGVCIVLLLKVESMESPRRGQRMSSSRNASNYNAFGEITER